MTARVGVLDWGIGGLDTLVRLRRRRPDLDLVYASDAGSVPYGRQSEAELAARLRVVAGGMEVTHLIVACNAASTVLARAELAMPTLGVIGPGVAAVLATDAQVLGVLGGERTIRSRAWEEPLVAAGRRVVARIAQPLSAHVEAGRLSGPELERDLGPILAPLREVDAVVLACTHYPAIAGPIAAHLPGVRLFDPVDAVVDAACGWGLSDGGGTLRVTTTGDVAAMRAAARSAFSVELPPGLERVTWS